MREGLNPPEYPFKYGLCDEVPGVLGQGDAVVNGETGDELRGEDRLAI